MAGLRFFGADGINDGGGRFGVGGRSGDGPLETELPSEEEEDDDVDELELDLDRPRSTDLRGDAAGEQHETIGSAGGERPLGADLGDVDGGPERSTTPV